MILRDAIQIVAADNTLEVGTRAVLVEALTVISAMRQEVTVLRQRLLALESQAVPNAVEIDMLRLGRSLVPSELLEKLAPGTQDPRD